MSSQEYPVGYKILQISGRWTIIGKVSMPNFGFFTVENGLQVRQWGTGEPEHAGLGALHSGPRPDTILDGLGGGDMEIPVSSIEFLLNVNEDPWEEICKNLQFGTHKGLWTCTQT